MILTQFSLVCFRGCFASWDMEFSLCCYVVLCCLLNIETINIFTSLIILSLVYFLRIKCHKSSDFYSFFYQYTMNLFLSKSGLMFCCCCHYHCRCSFFLLALASCENLIHVIKRFQIIEKLCLNRARYNRQTCYNCVQFKFKFKLCNCFWL